MISQFFPHHRVARVRVRGEIRCQTVVIKGFGGDCILKREAVVSGLERL